MQSTGARIGILIGVVVAAVVLFVVLSGGDDGDGGDETTVATTGGATSTNGDTAGARAIEVRNGKPVGGVQTLTYGRGDQVEVNVRLDQPAEEIHVHGYEISEPAETSPVRFSFRADIDGLFEIEVHSHQYGDVQIGELRVNP